MREMQRKGIPKQRKRLDFIIKFFFLFFGLWTTHVNAEVTENAPALPKNQQLLYNEEEQQYIRENQHIKVYVVDGMAPIQYQNEKGELQGITKNMFHELELLTGFIFDYIFIEDIHSALKEREAQIMAAIPFTQEDSEFYGDIKLSPEYLSANQTLLLHEGEKATNLKEKIFGAVIGTPVPDSVNQKTTVFFHTREEILDALNKGKIDFSYINAYSASYYLLQNSYDHIISIPSSTKNMELAFGYLHEEDILLPKILNAALQKIEPETIQNYLVEEATKINRKVSLHQVLNNFSLEITLFVFTFIGGLSYLTINSRRDKREIQLQNSRLLALSELSDEYFYEYEVSTDKLTISDELTILLTHYGYKEAVHVVQEGLRKTFAEHKGMMEEHNHSIESIVLTNGEEKQGIYKMINLVIKDDQHIISTIIGKLMDISSFELEKEQLKTKAERDGLTHLYNFDSSKKLIKNKILNYKADSLAAFIVLDIDYFKTINDTLGHQEGNRILQKLSKTLSEVFCKEDILARIGGDEFCIFVDHVAEKELLMEKCRHLLKNVPHTIDDVPISISMGIAYLKEEDNYQTAFKHADEALYVAKGSGRAQIAIYGEENSSIPS